jgi:hypothetical protein
MTLSEIQGARFDPPKLETLRVQLRDALIAKMDRQSIEFEPFAQDIARGLYDAEIGDQDVVEWAESRARYWHGQVVEQMRAAGALKGAGGAVIMRAGWNARVPYVRNMPTPEMIAEAKV